MDEMTMNETDKPDEDEKPRKDNNDGQMTDQKAEKPRRWNPDGHEPDQLTQTTNDEGCDDDNNSCENYWTDSEGQTQWTDKTKAERPNPDQLVLTQPIEPARQTRQPRPEVGPANGQPSPDGRRPRRRLTQTNIDPVNGQWKDIEPNDNIIEMDNLVVVIIIGQRLDNDQLT